MPENVTIGPMIKAGIGFLCFYSVLLTGTCIGVPTAIIHKKIKNKKMKGVG